MIGIFFKLGAIRHLPWEIIKDSRVVAIGFGDAKEEGVPPVYQKAFTSQLFNNQGSIEYETGRVYAMTNGEQPKDDAFSLVKCLPGAQNEIARSPAIVAGIGSVGVELHHTKPTLKNADHLAAAGMSPALDLLIADGTLKPEWGIYESDGTRQYLRYIGQPVVQKGTVSYFKYEGRGERVPDAPSYLSDGKGGLQSAGQ